MIVNMKNFFMKKLSKTFPRMFTTENNTSEIYSVEMHGTLQRKTVQNSITVVKNKQTFIKIKNIAIKL